MLRERRERLTRPPFLHLTSRKPKPAVAPSDDRKQPGAFVRPLRVFGLTQLLGVHSQRQAHGDGAAGDFCVLGAERRVELDGHSLKHTQTHPNLRVTGSRKSPQEVGRRAEKNVTHTFFLLPVSVRRQQRDRGGCNRKVQSEKVKSMGGHVRTADK